MNHRIHRLTFDLVSGQSNALLLARDGTGHPVLRGSAIAGVLRHAFERAESPHSSPQFFGDTPQAGSSGSPTRSALEVPDCPLDLGQAAVTERTHHLRDRHRGRVTHGGLYAGESCPPGTRTTVTLWLEDRRESPDKALGFLEKLAGLIQNGLHFGGRAARGIGFAELDGYLVHHLYDLNQLDDHAAYLDDHRIWREHGGLGGGTTLSAETENAKTLHITCRLGVPRGQDILVGDGQGIEFESEPQRVIAADGNAYWRLPGSTLRGLFRSWVARLAAREGRPVADNLERHRQRVEAGEELKGDDLGWCFEPQNILAHQNCPVARLFGSLHKVGRIHIRDAFCPISESEHERRPRMHVGIDQLTGGYVEHLLFDGVVLTSPVAFPVAIRVDQPTEDEARWLAQTLRSLDIGLLRVGSSKSAGRLSLQQPPEARGPFAEIFNAIQPCLNKEEWE
jgi:CRISPR/Cas system CSM-associated protein Csm3 (group 7 of RAMP superfamily)